MGTGQVSCFPIYSHLVLGPRVGPGSQKQLHAIRAVGYVHRCVHQSRCSVLPDERRTSEEWQETRRGLDEKVDEKVGGKVEREEKMKITKK